MSARASKRPAGRARCTATRRAPSRASLRAPALARYVNAIRWVRRLCEQQDALRAAGLDWLPVEAWINRACEEYYRMADALGIHRPVWSMTDEEMAEY